MQASSTPSNLKNSAWNLAGNFVYPVIFLALTPFFIGRLTDSVFGIWMLINSVVFISVEALFLGIGDSVTMFVAAARGRKDEQELHAVLNTSTSLALLYGLGVALVGALLYFLLRDASWLPLSDTYRELTLQTLAVATGVIAIRFSDLVFQSAFKGFERYDTASIALMAHRLGWLAANVALVLAGYGLVEMFWANVVVSLLVVLWQYRALLRQLPGYRFAFNFERAQRKRLLGFGVFTWIQSMVSLAAFQADRFVIAGSLGPNVVAYYSIASMISNHLHVGYGAITAWLFPKVSRLREEGMALLPLYHTLRTTVVSIGLVSLTLFYALSGPLFELWLGSEKAAATLPYVHLFVLYELLYLLTIVPKFFLNGSGQVKLWTGLEFAYKSWNIVLMFTLFTVYGTPESLVLGLIVSALTMLPIQAWQVNKRVLKQPPWQEVIGSLAPSFLLVAALALPGWWLKLMLLAAAALALRLWYWRPDRFQKALLLE